jgi:hypothetical protein
VLHLTAAFAGKWPILTYLIDRRCDALNQKIPLVTCSSHFVTSDLCKVAEQWGDVIGWNESNRAYILTYRVREVEWSTYRHQLPEHEYNADTKYSEGVRLIVSVFQAHKP